MQSPSTLTRALVHELAKDAAACELAAVRASAAACDYDEAAARILARALRGEPFALADVAEVLPGLDDLAPMAWVVAATSGDRAEALLSLVVAQRFAGDDVGADQEALALWLAWNVGDHDALRARVAPRVRLTARWKTTAEGTAVLAALVGGLGDARLSEELATLASRADATLAKELAAELARPVDAIVEALPADAASVRSSASGFTVRSAPKPGRNDPCPCGSGKKYKKCHGTKDDDATVASPVAGMSWEEYLRSAADKLTEAEVGRLVLRDLARVDLAKLKDGPLVAAVRRFAVRRRWDLGAKALDALAARASQSEGVDKHRGELVMSALAAGEIAFARAQAERLGARDAIPESAWLELEVGEGRPEALAHLFALADAAVKDDEGTAAVDLALALLARAPGLGVLAARAALRPDGGRDNDDLLVAIEDARALLHVAGGDVAHDFVKSLAQATARDKELLAAERETKKREGELGTLGAELREARARLATLDAEVETLRASLAPPVEATEDAHAPVSDEAERRALRAKVKELEGVIREGQLERHGLRQRLAAAEAETRAETDAKREREEPDDDDAEDVADAKRGVLVPRLPRRVELGLPELPQAVAAEALRTLGALAAGDESAWLRIKQAKDMPRQVLMARLGIHYRLLFRVADGELDVLDLVPREGLDATLKRLRSV